MWIEEQITAHKTAAGLLVKIKDLTFDYIKKNTAISEYEVQQFILNKFREFNLVSDKDPPIVAFNENSAFPHYCPKQSSKILTEDSLILIDLWAKLKNGKNPFADITWVAYHGKIPEKVQYVFKIVIEARQPFIYRAYYSIIKL